MLKRVSAMTGLTALTAMARASQSYSVLPDGHAIVHGQTGPSQLNCMTHLRVKVKEQQIESTPCVRFPLQIAWMKCSGCDEPCEELGPPGPLGEAAMRAAPLSRPFDAFFARSATTHSRSPRYQILCQQNIHFELVCWHG